MKAQTIDAVINEWRDGSPALAGHRVEELLPPERQVTWARELLAACVSTPSERALVQPTLDLASESGRWHGARGEFDRLRAHSLAAAEPSVQALLGLAEGVAKLAYNATGATGPFGSNVTAAIALRSRELVALKAPNLPIDQVAEAFAAGLRFPRGAA